MTFKDSPLLAMPPLTSPNNGVHRHRDGGEGSSGQQQDTNGNGPPNFHQIPFQATPVQHGPTPLTFGFGFGFGSSVGGAPSTSAAAGAATTPGTSVQWGQPLPSPSSSLRHSPSSKGLAAVMAGKRSEAKRRRDSDDDDSDDDMEGEREKSASPMSYNRVIASKQALPKRMRAGIGAMGMFNLEEARTPLPSSSSSSLRGSAPLVDNGAGASAAIDKMDLGKILSTLDKPSLLTLFSRLLTSSNDPTLRDQIIAHIPSPSLESVESALEEIEKGIKSASVHSGQMRAEFAWGRLRNPVGDFVATALGFLSFFVEEAKDGGVLSSRQETPHPSTSFTFLHALTIRTLRIIDLLVPSPSALSVSLFSFDGTKPFCFGNNSCAAVKAYQDLIPAELLTSSNPNTIVTQLVPSLLMQWTRLQEKLCKGVNEEGKMFGSEMMRGWIESLEALSRQDASAKVEERAFRAVLEGIGARLEQEVGWLIGLPLRGSNSQPWRALGPSSNNIHRMPMSTSSRASTHMEEEDEL